MQSCRLHLANIKCLARSAVPISSQKSSQSVYGQKVLRAPQPPLRSRYRQVAPRRRHMSLSAALWPTATVTWRGCAARRTEIRSCGNCHGNEWEPVTIMNHETIRENPLLSAKRLHRPNGLCRPAMTANPHISKIRGFWIWIRKGLRSSRISLWLTPPGR